MDMTNETLLTEADAGCWYDSHRGYKGIALLIIEDALIYGWREGEGWQPDKEAYEDNPETLNWDEEAATEFLGSLTPEDYWIGWSEGDFGMWPVESEEFTEE